MQRYLVRTAIVAVLVSGATVAVARLNGPPKGVTGAWALGAKVAEKNCQYCHDPANGLNDPSGLIEILDVPEQYELDTTYPIRVRLNRAWSPLPPDPLNWGFQLTVARADSGTRYGTLVPGIGTQLATSTAGVPQADPNRQYVQHTSAGAHVGASGPVEWSFSWQSPGYAASKVYFFAAGNASDGAQTSSDDFIFTTADSTSFGSVGVGDFAARTALAPPNPNPARGRTELSYSLARDGAVDLTLYDVNGRRVRTLVNGVRLAGPHTATWDGRDDEGRAVGAGLYFAKLFTGNAPVVVRKIALTH